MRTPTLPRRARNALLTVHIASSVALLGYVLALVVLTVRVGEADDPTVADASYETMETFSFVFGIPLSFTALLTGVALALGTRWGIFRYRWVTAKLALTVFVILAGALVIGPAETLLLDDTTTTSAADAARQRILVAGLLQVAALLTATGMSVFKPGTARQPHRPGRPTARPDRRATPGPSVRHGRRPDILRRSTSRPGRVGATMGTTPAPRDELRSSRRDLLRYLGGGGVALAVTGSRLPAVAAGPSAPSHPSDPVARWIDRRAEPLHGVDPDAPLIDLRPLARRLRGATVVGLGASYGAREPFLLRHRVTRLLVEHLGFRAVALEEDWTKGIELDRYARTGEGDPRALLSDAALPSRTEEVLDLVAWARAFNQRHPTDPVRLVGSDVVAVRALAYDAVTEHVARVAPDRSGELAHHYAELRPAGAIADHVQWYLRQPDKQPYVDHARQAYELVASLAATAPGHALATQHARTILGFYEYFATYEVGVRDRYMADVVGWWHDHVGAKVVYFASNVHTAVADPLTIHWGDMPPSTQTSAGGHLLARYGSAYRSVGVTFHHGSVNAGFPLAAHPVPAPAPTFLEAELGAGRGTYLLDLGAPLPRAVRRWLAPPLRSRAIGPFYDAAHHGDYAMASADPATWYDAVLHTPTSTPTRPFT